LILSRRIPEDFELINIFHLFSVEKYVQKLFIFRFLRWTKPPGKFSTTEKTGFQHTS